MGNGSRISRRSLVLGTAAGAAAVAAAGALGHRRFQLALGAPPAVSAATPAVPFASLPTPRAMVERFHRWFDANAIVVGSNAAGTIWNFWEPQRSRGSFIYPMLSGKAVIWMLERGDVARARVLADALLPWQQTRSTTPALARSYGAFPSKLEPLAAPAASAAPSVAPSASAGDARGAEWGLGTAFYSGDNLVIIDALTRLYEATRDPRYLNAAIGAGTWVVAVMGQGHRYGVWKEDHGAPMQMVSLAGDFVNKIYGQVEWLWIGALKRLARVTGEPAYARLADRARDFYLTSQVASGAYLDHYDPGYPPEPYAATRWQPYAPGQLISDNVLRAALGACRSGAVDSARRFRAWLKPDPGAVPAYLDLVRGGSGFERSSLIYYDVVSCGLLRSLAQWLDDRPTAVAAIRFLERTQMADGAWSWGILKRGTKSLTGEQAPIVGMWATADLSLNAGEP